MLLLEVGATGGLGASRVGEAVVGAVVGIAVSVLVAPPLYVQPAGEAIGELAHRMAGSAAVRLGVLGHWSRQAADHWMREVRGVGDGWPTRATVAQAEEAARLNPRGRRGRDARPRLRSTLTGLERGHITLRTIARAVLDRTYYMPEDEQQDAYTPGSGRPWRRADHRRRGRRRRSHRGGGRPRRTTPPRPGVRCRPTWPRSTATEPDWPSCSPSTTRPTRPRGPSTVRSWRPSTGCASRSPRPPERPRCRRVRHRGSPGRCAAGSTRSRRSLTRSASMVHSPVASRRPRPDLADSSWTSRVERAGRWPGGDLRCARTWIKHQARTRGGGTGERTRAGTAHPRRDRARP